MRHNTDTRTQHINTIKHDHNYTTDIVWFLYMTACYWWPGITVSNTVDRSIPEGGWWLGPRLRHLNASVRPSATCVKCSPDSPGRKGVWFQLCITCRPACHTTSQTLSTRSHAHTHAHTRHAHTINSVLIYSFSLWAVRVPWIHYNSVAF